MFLFVILLFLSFLIQIHLNFYLNLSAKIFTKYSKQYNICEFIYPKINDFMYLVKYQFNRSEMNYNFKPRNNNLIYINKHIISKDNLKTKKLLITNLKFLEKTIEEYKDYIFIFSDNIKYDIEIENKLKDRCIFLDNIFNKFEINYNKISKIGIYIYLIKRCEKVIGFKNNYLLKIKSYL